ncbi:MAG: tRNA (N6-threonylcarbamoyladenosine(37)-N6)-methyltransferase TrmO [Chloroflexi bacterium]|nr:MAG: tRNA (N6-threonylcarbamoyladenosine(37)-N6)-methyltransferase TrmO [Chloroflexota bacterium]
MDISYQPIGVIHTPFQSVEGVPIQPVAASGVRGHVEIFPEFADGLKDLSGFSHVILLYHLHLVRETRLTVVPFLDSQPHGVFATRAPVRPNPIGLSVVKLLGVEGNTLYVENVDVVDGTPLLDVKPYVSEFDHLTDIRLGWLEKARERARTQKSDDRFL